ncbi:MAG: chlorophyll synthase ChlG [Gemmatimonadaceae bacterium]
MTVPSVNHALHRASDWPEPRAVLELLKPVTWFPPMWAFACGAVSSGVAFQGRVDELAIGLAITGPLVCATSQAANDWYDRHVDAINEPGRPIPSGRIPGTWGFKIALAWTALSMAASLALGVRGMVVVAIALAFAWGYSAPPLRFKQNGWVGNLSVGLTYEGLAWVTGALVMLGGDLPSAPVMIVALLYSLGAHGIMTLNDFKAIEGDRAMGIRSLPASLGVERAAQVLCAMMVIPQLIVIGLLLSWGASLSALAIAALVVVQCGLMWRFLAAPRERALFLSAIGVPFYVSGMMVSAFALRSILT